MTSHTDLPLELEKAVQTLLKPPHVHYLKELHTAAQEDANYIFNNEATVGANVQTILVNEGVPWKSEEIKRQWARILGIAMHRIEEK
jgi:hypothetical protein